jgi:hypothetical protein
MAKAPFSEIIPEGRRAMADPGVSPLCEPTPILKPNEADLERAAMIKRQNAINGIRILVQDPETRETFYTEVDYAPPAFQKFLICKSPFAAPDEFGRKCRIVEDES